MCGSSGFGVGFTRESGAKPSRLLPVLDHEMVKRTTLGFALGTRGTALKGRPRIVQGNGALIRPAALSGATFRARVFNGLTQG